MHALDCRSSTGLRHPVGSKQSGPTTQLSYSRLQVLANPSYLDEDRYAEACLKQTQQSAHNEIKPHDLHSHRGDEYTYPLWRAASQPMLSM
jgi:hypothetical protein